MRKCFFFSGSSSSGSNFVVRKQIETFQLLKYLQRHRTISYHSSCEFGLKVLVKMLVFFLYQVEGGVKSLLTVSCILVFCATQSRSRIDQRMEERSKYDKVQLCSSYFHTKTFIPATTHIFSLRRTEEAVIKQRNIYTTAIWILMHKTSSVFAHTIKLFPSMEIFQYHIYVSFRYHPCIWHSWQLLHIPEIKQKVNYLICRLQIGFCFNIFIYFDSQL